MFYSKEYIAKALKKDYSSETDIRLNAFESCVVSIMQAAMLLCGSLIWVCAKIPFVSDLAEMFVRNYPRGAVGFFLRGAYFKAKLGHMGKNVLIDMGASIWNPEKVSIGDNSHIDTNVRIEGGMGVSIGSHVHITSNVMLQGLGTLTIGDCAGVAAGTLIYSGTNHYTDGESDRFYEMSACAPIDRQFVKIAPVKIGKSAFIGLNSVVLPGVTLGEGAIVGACSFVNSNIPDFKIAVGVPARVVGDRPRPR